MPRCNKHGTTVGLGRPCSVCVTEAREERASRRGFGQRRGSGDFGIGSAVWPGTAKLLEEMAEAGQVLAKLIAVSGEETHWDGSNLIERASHELGDVLGALRFFVEINPGVDMAVVEERASAKRLQFYEWHEAQSTPPLFDAVPMVTVDVTGIDGARKAVSIPDPLSQRDRARGWAPDHTAYGRGWVATVTTPGGQHVQLVLSLSGPEGRPWRWSAESDHGLDAGGCEADPRIALTKADDAITWMHRVLGDRRSLIDHNCAGSRHVGDGGPMTKTILVLKVTAERETTEQAAAPPVECMIGLESVPAQRSSPIWTADLIRQANALAKAVLYREGRIVQTQDQTYEVSAGFPQVAVHDVATGWRLYRAIDPNDREGWSTI